MKAILILAIVCLAGCGTINTVRRAFLADPGIDGKDKLTYMQQVEQAKADLDQFKANQKQFIGFQYVAMGFLVAGGLMVFLSKTNTALGAAFIGIALISSAWGLTASAHPRIVVFILLAVLVFGFAYIAWKQIAKNKTA